MIIALTNQKGGVGKTAVSINLAGALAELGNKTLVVDLDPQGNASDGLGIDINALPLATYDCMVNNTPLANIVHPTDVHDLFVAPSNINLSGAETELASETDRLYRLKKALQPVENDYDFILIDCPPSLGILTVNGIVASNELIIPVEPKCYSLSGMSMLMKTVTKIREDTEYNPSILGVVVNMFDERTTLHTSVTEAITEFFGSRNRIKTIIHRDIKVSEAELEGQPVTKCAPESRAAREFLALAQEVIDHARA